MFWRNRSLVEAARETPLFPSVAEVADLIEGAPATVFLGLDGEVAYFGIDISFHDQPEAHPAVAGRGVFEDLRTVGVAIGREPAAIMAHARGLLLWHARHRFCGACGSPAEMAAAGNQRDCTNPACGAHHFPRTDPAVIMLVTDGDRCLLAHRPRMPKERYSTLAGFVEPGESLEEAVAREVFEEVGVRVGNTRYFASQPWPFPASLMVGFHASALTTEIRVDGKELDHAMWVTRDQIRNPEAHGLSLSPPDSIARRLIERWLAD